MTGQPPAVDHLVFAVPDLDVGVERVERRLGVRPKEGGSHEGLGTRNVLVGLGPTAYLEVVSVDPAQGSPELPRWFGLDTLSDARLVTWAATSRRPLSEIVSLAGSLGVDLGEPRKASRRRPDGGLIEWTFTDPRADRLEGVVPFFIDWGTTVHPGASLPSPYTLSALRAEHPDPSLVKAVLDALGVTMPVSPSPRTGLIATLAGPAGPIELA